ncbi:MAG: DUF1990 family protein [Myxococcales bacterium]
MKAAQKLVEGLAPARVGVGPLLQRDYWAVLRGSRARPSELLSSVRKNFSSFAPSDLAAFQARCGDRALGLGDELDIDIPGAGRCCVRVTHFDAQSLTLATVAGHPEAGRITFGAYRDDRGDPIFHIRSRARSDSALRLLGFVVAGEAMQTDTWTDFISRVAAIAGGAIDGGVYARMQRLEEDGDDEDALDQPTFLARGD